MGLVCIGVALLVELASVLLHPVWLLELLISRMLTFPVNWDEISVLTVIFLCGSPSVLLRDSRQKPITITDSPWFVRVCPGTPCAVDGEAVNCIHGRESLILWDP
jgi:hypothetical protein